MTRSSYLALAVEDVLRCGLLESRVPHEAHAVRVSGVVRVLVVGGHEQLGEHGGPVHARDGTVLGPTLVVKVPECKCLVCIA